MAVVGQTMTITAVLAARDNMSSVFEKAGANAKTLGQRIKSSALAGAGMQIGMRAVNSAMNALTSSMGDAISRYDTMQNFPRVMQNLGVGADAAQKAVSTLSDHLTGLPTTLDSATSSVSRFTASNGDVNKSTKYFLAMNDAIVAGGASTELQSSAVEQLSQSYSKGKMDMMEWRSVQMAMPGQLEQIAKAMGMTSTQMGEGLRNGTISMDEFMNTMVELDKKGVKGFGSLEEQARAATGGIATNITTFKTAIVRGLAGSFEAVDTALKNNGMSTIGESISKAQSKITSAFTAINSAIENIDLSQFKSDMSFISRQLDKINWGGFAKGATGAFRVAYGFASKLAKILAAVIGFVGKHSEGFTMLATAVLGSVFAFKAFKKISKFLLPLKSFSKIEEAITKKGKGTRRATNNIKKAFSGLMKMAGLAMVIASIALLAHAMAEIGKLGSSAVEPMAAFALSVSLLAGVLAITGSRLQESAVGIGVFGAAVSAMALSMSLVAQAGQQGAANMLAFGAVIAGLAVTFALFGGALTTGVVGIAVFAAAISGMALSMSLIAQAGQQGATNMLAFGTVIAVLAGTFALFGGALTAGAVGIAVFAAAVSGITLSIAVLIGAIEDSKDGIETLGNAVSSVLDSMGNAALKAGIGFTLVAAGIGKLVKMSIADLGATLVAVGSGLKKISEQGESLASAGTGMQVLINVMAQSAGSVATFAAQLTITAAAITLLITNMMLIGTAATVAAAGFATLQTSTNALTGVPAIAQTVANSLRVLGSGATVAGTGCKAASSSISQVSSSAKGAAGAISSLNSRVNNLGANGAAQGNRFASGMKSGLNKSVTFTNSAMNKLNSRLKKAASQAYSNGANISRGLARGMRSALGSINAAANAMVKAANKAVRAKAKIHSPSRVFAKLGAYIGEGFTIGIESMARNVQKASASMVSIPAGMSMATAGGYSGGLNDDYEYGTPTVEVPLYINGREFARATSQEIQRELNTKEMRSNRKAGIR